MAKRFAVTLLIVLASCVFICAGVVLVLFLAPGLSVFGLKYIARGTHNVQVDATIEELAGPVPNSIIIEANEIPISVVYSDGFNYRIEYRNNYQGFTTSSYDDPTIAVYKDEIGNLVIKVNEWKKFVYESSSSQRELKLHIPLYLISSGYKVYATSLTINSDKSPVIFEKTDSSDTRIPTFKTLDIKTNGKLYYNTQTKATTFKLETNNKIVIPENREYAIDATNYELESHRGRIEINGDVSGDVTAKTKNGNISLLSCKNLVVETNYGSVFTSKKDNSITVNGITNIKTKAGSVYLGEIKGSGKNEITTSSGKVEIEKINDGEITTNFGNVLIRSARDVKVATNLGKIEINEALTSAEIETKRGDIFIGGDNLPVNNVKAYTAKGKIDVYSVSGNVELETAEGDINFTNTNSSNIKITCGGKLTATNLKGKIDIVSKGNVSLDFNRINDETRVELGEGVTSAVLKAPNTSASSVKYYIAGKNVVRYEVSDESETDSKIEDGESVENMGSTGPLFKVTGTNANIVVYFKA